MSAIIRKVSQQISSEAEEPAAKRLKTKHGDPLDAVALAPGKSVFGNQQLTALITAFLERNELLRFAVGCFLHRSWRDYFLQHSPAPVYISDFLDENPAYQEMDDAQLAALRDRHRSVRKVVFDVEDAFNTYYTYYHSLREILGVFCRATQTALREVDFSEEIPRKRHEVMFPGELDLSPIAQSPNLEKISICIHFLAEAHWKALLAPPNLRQLRLRWLDHIAIPKECYPLFAKLTHLKIDGAREHRPQRWHDLLSCCTGVTTLAIRSLGGVAMASIDYKDICSALSNERHPNLTSLDLSDDSSKVELSQLPVFAERDELATLKHIGKNCSHLRELNLKDWHYITDRTLLAMRECWPKGLQKLTLSGRFTSLEGIAGIPRPKLAELFLVNCPDLKADLETLNQALTNAQTAIGTVECTNCPQVKASPKNK